MSVVNPPNGALKEALTHVEVARMRRDGFSIPEIAAHMRVPPVRVRVILSEALNQLSHTSLSLIEEHRALELDRLDVATKAIMPKVVEGDQGAIHTMVKLMHRRAALLGLDAPREVVSRNFTTIAGAIGDMSPDQLRELPTEQLKLMVMRAASVDATDL